jgi:hypothetical protein
MKTIFLTAIVLALTGCATKGAFLKTDVGAIEFSAEPTGGQAVSVEASSSWLVEISGLEDWLSVYYDRDDPRVFHLTALVNESPEGRDDSVYVSSGDGLSLILPVVQKAMDGRLTLTPAALDVFAARNAAPQTITVDSGLTWEESITEGDDWISLTREGNILTVGVSPTRSTDARSGLVQLSPLSEAFAEFATEFAVEQHGIDLLVESETLNPQTLEIAVPAEGGAINLGVYSRYDWTLSTDADPDRVSFNITSGGADLVNGMTVVMTATANTTGGGNENSDDHTFTLTFASEGETYEYLCRQPIATTEPQPQPEP